MFKEIAGENNIQRIWRQRPFNGAIVQKKMHVAIQSRACVRIQIHRILFPCRNVIYKFAVAAAEIQNRALLRDQRLKKSRYESRPDFITVALNRGKSPPVLIRELRRTKGLIHISRFHGQRQNECRKQVPIMIHDLRKNQVLDRAGLRCWLERSAARSATALWISSRISRKL